MVGGTNQAVQCMSTTEAGMNRLLVVEFTKMTGAGNDFIVIDNRFYHFTDTELGNMARSWCPRRTGIGADGLLALNPSHEYDWHMRYVNADGSFGTMCGNGARCLARFARLAGISGTDHTFFSDAGVYTAHIPDEGPVRLYVPTPRAFKQDVPMDGQTSFPVACTLWTGTEHAVVFTEEVDVLDLTRIGPSMRSSRALGHAGANVDFVHVTGPHSLKVRTFEKGVEAETLACGTGALASTLVAAHLGHVQGPVVGVTMPGGELHVGFNGDPLNPTGLYLEGPAEVVYRGTVDMIL